MSFQEDAADARISRASSSSSRRPITSKAPLLVPIQNLLSICWNPTQKRHGTTSVRMPKRDRSDACKIFTHLYSRKDMRMRMEERSTRMIMYRQAYRDSNDVRLPASSAYSS